MALPNFCARCFWYFLHCGTAPFSIFPAIFRDFDLHQKALVQAHIDKHGHTPTWMGDICSEMSAYKDVKRLEWQDEKNAILLTGDPDAVFCNSDRSKTLVGDYKTARYSEGQDALLPLYRAQVLCYAFLLEKNGDDTEKDSALFYFEPPAKFTSQELLDQTTKAGFTIPFSVTVVELPIGDFTPIHDYLSKARAIYDCEAPPDGKEHCKDCKCIDRYIKKAEDDERAKDKWTGRIAWIRDAYGTPRPFAIRENTTDIGNIGDDEDWSPSWAKV